MHDPAHTRAHSNETECLERCHIYACTLTEGNGLTQWLLVRARPFVPAMAMNQWQRKVMTTTSHEGDT